MFERERTCAAARAHAEALVGKQALSAELALPHASSYIQKHVELYKQVGRGAVPKLMFPKATMTGTVGSADFLCATIVKELGN